MEYGFFKGGGGCRMGSCVRPPPVQAAKRVQYWWLIVTTAFSCRMPECAAGAGLGREAGTALNFRWIMKYW
jgi:hypothetical protein